MEIIDSIKSFELISSKIPNRILKIQGFIIQENLKEKLELIIFKGFSSSTTHPTQIDSEKNVIDFSFFFTNFQLFKAPLTKKSDILIKETKDPSFFLNSENWI